MREQTHLGLYRDVNGDIKSDVGEELAQAKPSSGEAYKSANENHERDRRS
jgi:hypothetical protein